MLFLHPDVSPPAGASGERVKDEKSRPESGGSTGQSRSYPLWVAGSTSDWGLDFPVLTNPAFDSMPVTKSSYGCTPSRRKFAATKRAPRAKSVRTPNPSASNPRGGAQGEGESPSRFQAPATKARRSIQELLQRTSFSLVSRVDSLRGVTSNHSPRSQQTIRASSVTRWLSKTCAEPSAPGPLFPGIRLPPPSE